MQSIRRIDVYRLAEKPGPTRPLTEEEFSSQSTLIGSVTYEQIKNADQELSYTDKLELAGEPTKLRYAVRYVNAAGQRAAFSNFLSIEPAAKIAQAPGSLQEKIEETGITLTWQPPAANIDGSTPVNLLGYNIYRMDESQTDISPTPLNSAPLTGTQFTDKTFEFDNSYRYVVRSVSLGTEGSQVESLNSNAVSVSPRDTFPPSAPVRLSVIAGPGRISIFFPANEEPDIAGYNVYRSTDENLPKTSWTKLNPTLLTRTTFQDENLESGKRYFYYLKAVDKAGNISEASEVESDVVP